MIKRLTVLVSCMIVLFALAVPAAAQDTPPQPQRVEVEASDGLVLVGTYYAPAESGAPAVLLMHHSGSRKEAWIDFIPFLLDAGYATLAVDLRGHGETRGRTDWTLAEDDAHRWLAWLRDQPDVDPDRVSIVGASIGADLGLRVMAADERLVTLVGLSALLDAQGVFTEEAVAAIGPRPLYLIAGQGAEDEANAIRTLIQVAEGDFQARLYDNGACCTFLFLFEDDLAPSIITWLDTHN
jgi:pimeloyl-ACP methyl ester carboxylesterase